MSINMSLFDNVYLSVLAFDVYRCQEIYVEWNIVRADGEIEMYNAAPQDLLRYNKEYPEKGLMFYTDCSYNYCHMRLQLSPTDLRYNAAQFTCNFSLPECGTINITDPVSVNIQGDDVSNL